MLNLKRFALGLVIALVLFAGKTIVPATINPATAAQAGLQEKDAIVADAATLASGNITPWLIPESTNPPTVRVNHQFYPIIGSSASEIRGQMAQRGPFDQLKGQRFDARTTWRVQWNYQYARSESQCRLQNPAVRVDVTILYPAWVSQKSAPPSLRRDWQQYMAALQQHEAGHQANGINAGNQILQALQQMPTYPSCQALSAAVKNSTQEVVKLHNQFDRDYDRITGHGATQGAIFPPTTTALQ